jgi:hypothetical protein
VQAAYGDVADDGGEAYIRSMWPALAEEDESTGQIAAAYGPGRRDGGASDTPLTDELDRALWPNDPRFRAERERREDLEAEREVREQLERERIAASSRLSDETFDALFPAKRDR